MSAAPTTSPDLGLLLDGRYRVGEPIARGGMATVHRGHDERLDRPVALKIMHPHLADDPEFRARFSREARSVARLSHPHVVSVFDQGEDSGRVYLAMELIEGPTLRQVLTAEGPLPLREALRISIAVVQALRAAHRSGIVHRDIKPENILIAEDGRVTVADFGLARAIGTSTSSSSGTLLGTVAYISPEVVTRGHCDERSDLYSFGVVLYEMLTGVQPFTGELPVHVAFQHVHEDIPAPSLRMSTVPRALDSLITWCCARTPRSRPASADELLASLDELTATLPPEVLDARPQAIAGGAATAATGDLPRLTAPLDVLTLQAPAPPRPFVAPAEADDDGTQEAPAEPRTVALRPPRMRHARHRRRGRSRSGAVRVAALALVGLLLAGGAWAGTRWYATAGPGGDRTVPVVAGRPLNQAEAALTGQDLEVRTRETFSDSVPSGHVVSVSPAAGTTLKRDQDVTLVVSRGVRTYAVPDLTGRTLDEARADLTAQHLTLVEDEKAYDEHVEAGHVISQSASAAQLPAGGEVHVVISRGREPIAVPDQRGRTAGQATGTLKGQGFIVRQAQAHSASTPKGAVISQRPLGGTGHRGDTVTIVVSQGPEMVAVPDVFHKPEAQARQILTAAGFRVTVLHDKGTPVFGQVYQQDPRGGTAAKGSVVTIHVF